jgi:hypothetical protein
MNFDAAERLRTELNGQIDHLKTVKTKTQQNNFNSFIRNHQDSINELLKELDNLKEDFNLFKLHTLSTVELKSEQHVGRGRCVTNPFSIYVIQK